MLPHLPTSISITQQNTSVSGRIRCEHEEKLSYVAKILTRQIRVMYKDAAFQPGQAQLESGQVGSSQVPNQELQATISRSELQSR